MQKYLIHVLINNNLIEEKDKDIYQYGIETFFLKLIHYILIMCIALYMNFVLESVIFLVIYNSIRGIIGGYHAKKRWICLIYTAIIYFTLFLLTNSDFLLNNTISMIIVHFILSIIILYGSKYNYYINKLYTWILIIFLVDVIFCLYNMNNFVVSCTYALFISLMLNLLKNE